MGIYLGIVFLVLYVLAFVFCFVKRIKNDK